MRHVWCIDSLATYLHPNQEIEFPPYQAAFSEHELVLAGMDTMSLFTNTWTIEPQGLRNLPPMYQNPHLIFLVPPPEFCLFRDRPTEKKLNPRLKKGIANGNTNIAYRHFCTVPRLLGIATIIPTPSHQSFHNLLLYRPKFTTINPCSFITSI